jgi:MerR family transcriptional regulator/heat shock protein HspR
LGKAATKRFIFAVPVAPRQIHFTMNDHRFPAPSDLPVFGEDFEVCYTMHVIAEMAGIDCRTVLHYENSGFIRPVKASDEGQGGVFDDECLRMLRRMEHLRATYAVNDAGLRLILDLLHEVELLHHAQRAHRS